MNKGDTSWRLAVGALGLAIGNWRLAIGVSRLADGIWIELLRRRVRTFGRIPDLPAASR